LFSKSIAVEVAANRNMKVNHFNLHQITATNRRWDLVGDPRVFYLQGNGD
jgi:hypothetical protein